ncbi:MAG: rhomboid family intramembrane serine protease [Anaerolineae bacterium]|nr:rhomboid family intramembrane serine protease [Anaerolineae bacterium]
MLPLQDLNPRRRMPVFTYTLIIINVIVFIWELSLAPGQLDRMFMDLAAVPASISHAPFSLAAFIAIIRSMFFHGGFDHIIGNMLYLWLFGDNVEDRLGGVCYLILYFVSGFAAAFAQVLISPESTVPMIGASGAIAGVLGSYFILFPGVRVRGIIPLGRVSQWVEWPAWLVLGFWFALQVVDGFASLGADTSYGGGVAFAAHVGGFVAGIVLTWLLTALVPQPGPEVHRASLYQRAARQQR